MKDDEHLFIECDVPSDVDPFGLRKVAFSSRVPESSEMFNPREAQTYIDGCDYPGTVDYLLPALRIQEIVGSLTDKTILDAMCGPGVLGRELLTLGAPHVVFHDGDPRMINHAVTEASGTLRPGQQVHSMILPVDQLRPANFFDLVVCQNSLHQLTSIERLREAIESMLRVTRLGGLAIIFDYQRANSPGFLAALEERLMWTRPDIVPLLIPTFMAAFSRPEFEDVLSLIPGIKGWSVNDARLPNLTPERQAQVDHDPVKGHVLDRSPISLEIIIQKEEQ